MLTGTREPASASWRALGTSVVLKLTDSGALAHARRIVEQQVREMDRACSRFRADSELERVNARAGVPVRVGEVLIEAVEVGLRAARLTDGDVDPALGEALLIAGYDRDYGLLEYPVTEREDAAPERRRHEVSAGGGLPEHRRAGPRVLARRTVGWRTIVVDRGHSTVRVGRGVRLDLGATAKALAADRAAHTAHEATGAGVLVSLGGDIALAGPGPAGGWRVFVTDDHRSDLDAEGQTISISAGGLASSSTTTRRWIHDGQRMHHIIDPGTGAPVELDVEDDQRGRGYVRGRQHRQHRGARPWGLVCGVARRERAAGPPCGAGRARADSRRLARRAGASVRDGSAAGGGTMTLTLGTVGPSVYWYLTRSTGVVALVLLTMTVVLGVIDVSRWSSPRWPRFVVDSLHRSVSMLVLVFLALHIITAALDSFAPISLLDAVLPFIGSYRPFWLGLGAVAFDLLLAVTITSLLRERLGHRAWRIAHWLAYACWPIALLHGLGTGSDVKNTWLLALNIACLGIVALAVGVRAIAGWPDHARVRIAALGGVAVFSLFLLVWLPGGPLGGGWARRSGTPTSLLAGSSKK